MSAAKRSDITKAYIITSQSVSVAGLVLVWDRRSMSSALMRFQGRVKVGPKESLFMPAALVCRSAGWVNHRGLAALRADSVSTGAAVRDGAAYR